MIIIVMNVDFNRIQRRYKGTEFSSSVPFLIKQRGSVRMNLRDRLRRLHRMVNRGTFTIDHMAVVYFSSNMEYANKIRELIKSKKRINMRDVTLFEDSELAKDGRKSMDSVLVALIIDTRNMLDKLTKQGIIVQKEDGYDCIRRVVHKKIKQNKEFSFIVYSILNSNCIHGINIVEKYENN